MTMGVGAALSEELAVDTRLGFFVNHDLAGYEVPVHADIPHQEVVFLDETDPVSSPMKAKGVGELGLCGVSAAVANAIDRTFAGSGQPWRDGRGQAGKRDGVQRDKSFDAVRRLLGETTRLGHACIVDQDADADIIAQTRFNSVQVGALGQIRRKYLDSNTGIASQALGQGVQPRLVSRDQEQIDRRGRVRGYAWKFFFRPCQQC